MVNLKFTFINLFKINKATTTILFNKLFLNFF